MKIEPNYDLKNDLDLSKFLLGAIRDVRKNELDVDKATVISQLADKYTKNEIMRLIKHKQLKNKDFIDVESESNRLLMNKLKDNE